MDPSPRVFEQIPGVGPKIARVFFDLGFHSIAELQDENPEELYERLCAGGHVDRSLLYVLRSAVYLASHERHDPELLQWWNWKGAG